VRAEQAQRRRERIVEAARALFLERGFAATTIAGVAEAAHVAPETVYAAFGGKAGLLEAVVLAAVLRDDEPESRSSAAGSARCWSCRTRTRGLRRWPVTPPRRPR
jgi:AcrR family transcriptional regulator